MCPFDYRPEVTIILIHLAGSYTPDVRQGRFLKIIPEIEGENDFHAFRDLYGFKKL